MPSSYDWKYSPARPATLYSMALLAILFVSSANGQGQSDDEERVGPPALLSAPLSEIPGTNLVVVELNFAPNTSPPSTAEVHPRGHHPPGSVFVYVKEGAVRLALEGEPVQIVREGEGFFEPADAHHIITENASATEPATAIAVMLVPDGEPILRLHEPE